MTKDEAISKIKKLLRMKRGGTPEEVATALALASELASKHSIDLESIDPDAEETKPITHIDAKTAERIGWECKYAAGICRDYFNVSYFLNNRWHQKAIVFVGTDWDIQIAQYIYDFLVGHFRRSWNQRVNVRLRDRRSFLWGMYIGLSSKLREQKTFYTSEALVLISRGLARRNDYISKTFGELTSNNIAPSGDAAKSRMAGYYAGLKTEIRAGLNNHTGQATTLLSQ